jgi:hypothetical protein
MDYSYGRLAELLYDAECAYQRARLEVFDHLSRSAQLDPDRLSKRQRAALDRLDAAEDAVADYRARMYDESAVSHSASASYA